MKIDPDKDEFNASAEGLMKMNELFSNGQITSFDFTRRRDVFVSRALLAMAESHGIEFQSPLNVDGRGEYTLIARPKEGGSPAYGAGEFGDALAKVLNEYQPCTGVVPGAHLDGKSGWCRMNHFDAERMVMRQYDMQIRLGQAQLAASVAARDVSASGKMAP